MRKRENFPRKFMPYLRGNDGKIVSSKWQSVKSVLKRSLVKGSRYHITEDKLKPT